MSILLLSTFVWLPICGLITSICYVFWLKPEICRRKLRKQGIRGPSPSFVFGNIPEMKQKMGPSSEKPDPADCFSTVFPYFKQWTKNYGHKFMFALWSIQLLYVTDPSVVRDIRVYRSLDMGKPDYLQKDRGALLGKGLITTNGAVWSHQRKTLAPQFHLDKVKDMLSVMMESGTKLVRTWQLIIEIQGGIADIAVDDHVRGFTSNIISKLVFGDDHEKGMKIFPKCDALIKSTCVATTLGFPLLRFLPTKGNRDSWRLAKEVHSMIMDITNKRKESDTSVDILQVILEGSKNLERGQITPDEFIVDNCKDLFLAASEVTAIASMWGLMLLASHPEWQERARSEVLEICNGGLPDFDMLGKMKILKMVIHEVLRLYPGVAFASRLALQDLKIGDMEIPKGVNIWVFLLALHRDPELWGSDADKFNPERFVNGVSGACRSPNAYIPFGFGVRVCPGQNLAMTEMKLLFAMILTNFRLDISPNYRHSPKFHLLLEPEHGIKLLIQKI